MNSSYFASANGYNGFTSLFNEKFNSKNLDKVFILKGGPGTGKSTFINKILSKSTEYAHNAERYFCSSDVKSLDGAIIDINDKKIAIIDGTAPHERDTTYVGAIDELVNLGESLHIPSISSYKERIIHLVDLKSDAYKNAYRYLKVAGECDLEIYKMLELHFNKASALEYIDNIANSLPKRNNSKSERGFISSFSKDGYNTIIPNDFSKLKHIKVGGDKRATILMINLIKNELGNQKTYSYLSPLNTDHIEYLKVDDEILLSYSEDDSDVNTNDFLRSQEILKEQVKVLDRLHNELLLEAVRWFRIASNIHFELEQIYISCMDFEKNDIILAKTYEKILKICS